jgi:hypothetical protein
MEPHQFACEFEKLNRMVPEKAMSATAHIFAAKSAEQQLVPFGTGTLLSIGNRRFLVTAGHVRTEQKKRGFDFLCSGTRKGGFTPLIESNWYLYEKLDIAIFALTSRNITDFESNSFANLSDIALDVDTSDGIYALFGISAVWSSSSLCADDPPVKAKALQFITNAYEGSTERLIGFDPAFHIALNAGETDHRDFDGTQIRWPDRLNRFLPGISGCGIWKLCHQFDPNAPPDSKQSRMVAVETGVYSDRRIVKGTKWGAVAELIQQAFPDLRPAFNLAWPPSRVV